MAQPLPTYEPVPGAQPDLRLLPFDTANPYAPSHQYRMRWENLAVIALVLVAAALAVALVYGLARDARQSAPGTGADDRVRRIATPIADTPSSTEPAMTASQADRLVAEARVAMLAGRFDEADRLLADVDGDVGDASGASAVRDENANRHARFQAHARELLNLVAQRRWSDAHARAVAARKLAPLPPKLAQADRRAVREMRAASVLAQASELSDQGDTAAALALAQSGYTTYRTPALADLVAELAGVLAQQSTPGGPSTQSTAPPSQPRGTRPGAPGTAGASAAHSGHGTSAAAVTAAGMPGMAGMGMPGMAGMTPQQLQALIKKNPQAATQLLQTFVAGGGGAVGSSALGGLTDPAADAGF